MPYISVIAWEEADGKLKEIYDGIIRKRGKLSEVLKIQSLNAETILTHMDLYVSIMFSQSPLTRARREMMAVVVSATNSCDYCQAHHAQALMHYWKDEEKVTLLRKDFRAVEMPEQDKLLCLYAELLTKLPEGAGLQAVESLKRAGFGDRAVLDATMVIAYFNFVNRMVLGLGVELEPDQGTGYKY